MAEPKQTLVPPVELFTALSTSFLASLIELRGAVAAYRAAIERIIPPSPVRDKVSKSLDATETATYEALCLAQGVSIAATV